jgi:hypothetical protein
MSRILGVNSATMRRNIMRVKKEGLATLTPIFGRSVLTTQGDKIGTRGGMGFAGPMFPIVRGSKKIEASTGEGAA